jgi:hypothetical protein
LRNLVVEYVVRRADEMIHADPTKCLLPENADTHVAIGVDVAATDAAVVPARLAVVEKAAAVPLLPEDASVAILEDICNWVVVLLDKIGDIWVDIIM